MIYRKGDGIVKITSKIAYWYSIKKIYKCNTNDKDKRGIDVIVSVPQI